MKQTLTHHFHLQKTPLKKIDPCHELVWNLDACNRTMSMDERRIENIRKFFDKVQRDDPIHG